MLMGNKVKSTYQAFLLIWGINAALLMMLAPTWWQGAVAGLLMAMIARVIQTKAASLSHDAGTLPKLVSGVVPVWRNNIELARSQTQEAIDALTQRFVGIHQRLGGAANPIDPGRRSDVLSVIEKCALQLGDIARALEQVVYTHDVLLHKFVALNEHNQHIAQLAGDIGKLASVRHSHSESDKVMTELQTRDDLLDIALSASRSILTEAAMIEKQIQAAQSSSQRFGADASAIILNSRTVIDNVVTSFRQSALMLSDVVRQLEDESREVDQEICDILVHLQFQDRISQILDHVQRNMLKLTGVVENAASLPSCESWLRDLEKTYTTQEQRQVHAGQVADRPMQSQVDFF